MLETLRNSYSKIGTYIVSLTILFIVIMGYLLMELSILNFILFIIYISIYIYLPGKIMFRYLKINLFDPVTEKIIFFYLGFFFIIVQYFVFSYLEILSTIRIFSPVVIIIIIIYHLLKGSTITGYLKTLTLKIDTTTSIFMSINMLLSAGLTLFLYPKPDIVPYAMMKPDIAWHMGNVNILSGNNGNMDYRVEGVKFVYHYFSDLFYAIVKYIFGISAYELIVQFQFVVIGIILTTSVLIFFKNLLKNRRFIILATIILMYAPTLHSRSFNTMVQHNFSNVNAMALTLPVLLIFVILVKKVLEERQRKEMILLCSIFLFLLAGLKGPIALAIIISMVVLTILLAIQKKCNLQWCMTLLSCILAYILIHFTLLNKGTDLVQIGLLSAFDVVSQSPIFSSIIDQVDNYVILVLFMVPHFIIVTSIFSIPYLINIVRNAQKLMRKEPIQLFEQFCIVFSVLSMGAYYIIRHSGFSQMYFLFGAIPIIYYLGAKEFERYASNGRHINLKRKWYFIILFLCISLVAFANTLSYVRVSARQILHNFTNNIERQDNGISELEYAGLMWLRQNTYEQALLATNRHNDNNRFFLYSAYSERRFYIEGYEYSRNSGLEIDKAEAMLHQNDLLFSPSFTNKHDLALTLHIDYVILYKHEKLNSFSKDKSGFQALFDNDDISIYKVIK